ncbi:MAG: hypothetical protein B7Z20_08065, partial [Sphingobium sp. 32-64-5]
MRHILLATTAIIGFSSVVSGAAVAQEAADQASMGLGDIVVTAQRKEESLQKAAVAIDAVTGASLTQQGILKAEDITKSVP